MSSVENKQKSREIKAEEVSKKFFELLWTNGNRKAIVAALSKQMATHPTAQSGFWLVVQRIAEIYSNLPDTFFDIRNEDARKLAKTIAEADYCPTP